MITAEFRRGKRKAIWGFTVTSHADPKVCAAVSAFAINCANSIERFTDVEFSCDVNDDGFLTLTVPAIRDGGENHDCELLLNSTLLGLQAIEAEHPKELRIVYVNQ